MAVATNAKFVSTGIMGIGFSAGESLAQTTEPYPNIIDQMVTQGLINTRAYSLWLDDLGMSSTFISPHTTTNPNSPHPPDSPSGTILFGGYDTAKFSGNLIALQIQPDLHSNTITSMTVAWTSLSLTDPITGTQLLTYPTFIAPAILDSGTTLTGLPTALYAQLAAFAGVVNDPTYGALVNCNLSAYTGTLDYGFGGPGGPVIAVPFAELAIPAVDMYGDPLTFLNGAQACIFGLFPIQEGQSILFGDTFLRSTYVVYDLDNREIALAPTVFNTTVSNVVEIKAGAGGGARNVATGVTAVQTATGVGAPGIAGTGTVTGTVPAVVSLGAVGGVRTEGGVSATPTATKSSAAVAGRVLAFDGATLLVLGGWIGMIVLGGIFFSLL